MKRGASVVKVPRANSYAGLLKRFVELQGEMASLRTYVLSDAGEARQYSPDAQTDARIGELERRMAELEQKSVPVFHAPVPSKPRSRTRNKPRSRWPWRERTPKRRAKKGGGR